MPGSPDRVVPVAEVEGLEIEQVMVGSCTNSSWEDMQAVTRVLEGRRGAPSCPFVVFPGSPPILEGMAREGPLARPPAAPPHLPPPPPHAPPRPAPHPPPRPPPA